MLVLRDEIVNNYFSQIERILQILKCNIVIPEKSQ